MPDEKAATVRDWVTLVRRVRLGRTDKAVAFALALYADADGTRIFPGVARLSVECELTYNVVQQSLARLRSYGLVEVVRRATIRGRADEYRLTISPDLLEHVTVLSPTDVTRAVEKVNATHRGRHRVKPDPDPLHPMGKGAADGGTNDLHPTAQGADPVDNCADPVDNAVDEGPLHPTANGAAGDSGEPPAPHGVGSKPAPAPHGVVHLHPTPLATTSHRPTTRTTTHTVADLSDQLELSRAQGRQDDTIRLPKVSDPLPAQSGPYRSRHAAPDNDPAEPSGSGAVVIPFPRSA